MIWNNTKPNPFSFKRFPDGSGRVWSWQFCSDPKCDVCWVTSVETGKNILPLKQSGQELMLLNYDAWEYDNPESTTIKDSTFDKMHVDLTCHFECGQSGGSKCLVAPYDIEEEA